MSVAPGGARLGAVAAHVLHEASRRAWGGSVPVISLETLRWRWAMRRMRGATAVGGSFLAGVLISIAAVSWGAPGDGMVGTPHDFSTGGRGVGLCIYCHAPGRLTSRVLLWNQAFSTDG